MFNGRCCEEATCGLRMDRGWSEGEKLRLRGEREEATMCRLWRSGDGATRYGRWGSDQERRRASCRLCTWLQGGPLLGYRSDSNNRCKKKTKYVYKRYLAHSARTKVNRLHIFNLVDLTINKIYFLPTLTSRTATGC